MEARTLTNPYEQYSPAELLREWSMLQSGVDRQVESVAKALKKRKEGDLPVGLNHAIEALKKSATSMTLIETVVEKILKETRSYKLCGCWDTGEDKGTVFTYGAAILDASLSITSAAILIKYANQSPDTTNPWIPFGITSVNTVAAIAKDYGWGKLEEYQTDISKLSAIVNKDGLEFVNGIIKSFSGMQKVDRKLQSSGSENELENDFRSVGAFPSSRSFPLDLFANHVITVKKARPGSRLHAVAQLIIDKNKKRQEKDKPLIEADQGNWKKMIKKRKTTEGFLYQRDESEGERRKQIQDTFVEATCCDWNVDVETALSKAVEIRRNINMAIDGIDNGVEQGAEQIDFSALIELLNSSKKELNDDLLYLLDTFLREESKWKGTSLFKLKAKVRSGIHCLANVASVVVLGVDGYQQSNGTSQSKNLTIAATVMIIASLVLGKWNDWMYKDLVNKRARRGELERIRRHVEVTIKRCEGLTPFYQNLQQRRQQERALTLQEVESSIQEVSQTPRRYRYAAAKCFKKMIKEKSIETSEGVEVVTEIERRRSKKKVRVVKEFNSDVNLRRIKGHKPLLEILDSEHETSEDDEFWHFDVKRVQVIDQGERIREISNYPDIEAEADEAPQERARSISEALRGSFVVREDPILAEKVRIGDFGASALIRKTPDILEGVQVSEI